MSRASQTLGLLVFALSSVCSAAVSLSVEDVPGLSEHSRKLLVEGLVGMAQSGSASCAWCAALHVFWQLRPDREAAGYIACGSGTLSPGIPPARTRGQQQLAGSCLPASGRHQPCALCIHGPLNGGSEPTHGRFLVWPVHASSLLFTPHGEPCARYRRSCLPPPLPTLPRSTHTQPRPTQPHPAPSCLHHPRGLDVTPTSFNAYYPDGGAQYWVR